MAERRTLITSDMIKLVKSSIANATITKENFDEVRSFSIGRCTMVRNTDGTLNAYLDTTFDADYKKIWKADVGYVLTKELRKKEPMLYVMSDGRFKALIKLISDDEYDRFKENGFDHFKMGDYWYTIIRIVKKDGGFQFKDSTNDYVIEDENPYDQYEMFDNDKEQLAEKYEDELKETELF